MRILPLKVVWLVTVATLSAMAPASAAEAEPPQVGLAMSREVFSPNGDGVQDAIGAIVVTDAAGALTLEVLDTEETIVRTVVADLALEPGETRINWRGLDEDHRVVPDGAYVVRATLVDGAGASSIAEALVAVDTVPPTIRWRSISPQPVARASGRVKISFRVIGAERGRLFVTDVAGTVVHRDGWDGRERGLVLAWDMRTERGDRVPPGLYRVSVIARDAAGNRATNGRRPLRDVHPVHAEVVTSVEGVGNRVALTFDDCTDRAAWARILTALADADADASFFCPGMQVLSEPALARRTARDGHTIGAHGWDHADLTRLDLEQIRDRLARDEAAWWTTTGAMAVPFFRPPYGALDGDVRRAAGSLGYRWVALWDVDPRDWESPGVSAIVSRVLSHARGGSIVVLHTKAQTAAALPAILSGLAARGLEPVTLFDLVNRASTIRSGRVERMPV